MADTTFELVVNPVELSLSVERHSFELAQSGVKGDAGTPIEIQNSGTHIQWRYVGDVSWTNIISVAAITGATGSTGAAGAAGADGEDGTDGAAATIAVGTVTTGNPGTSATITNAGTSSAAIFNFTIPRGDVGATGSTGSTGSTGAAGADGADGREVEIQNSGTQIQWRYVGDVSWTNIVSIATITGPTGETGSTGPTGSAGTAATIAVGSVSTGAPGSSATVTNVGTSGAAVFDFAIPRGDVGATGSTGATGSVGPAGADGADGEGVPVGGTTGQVLTKVDNTDYNTSWQDAGGSGLTHPQIMARVSVGF